MTPAALVVRAEIRRRWGSLLLLAVMVALVTATVLATTAGARRTSTALDRFMTSTAARDLHVAVLSPDFALDPGRVDLLRQRLAEVPGVELVSAITVAAVGVEGTYYDFGLMTSPDGRYFHDIERPVVLAGRLPALASTEEVAINETAAAGLGLGVGDTLAGPTFSAESTAAFLADDAEDARPDGPGVALEVVGIVRQADELSLHDADVFPAGIVSPAYFEANRDRVGFGIAQYALRVDRSVVSLFDVLAVARNDAGEYETFASWVEDQYVDEVRGAHRTLSLGLTVFAAIAALVGALAVFQALGRHLAVSSEAHHVLRVLGLARWPRVLAVGGASAGAVVLGVVVGIGGAFGGSAAFPFSIARRAEVHPGVDLDPVVLLGGGLVIVVTMLALVTWSARRTTGRPPVPSARWSARVGHAVRWSGPVAGVGVTMALDPSRGRSGIPARSALLGAVLGVAGVAGVLVFARSVEAGRTEATRFGWTWDTNPDLLTDDPEAVVEIMVGEPGLAAVAAVSCGPLRLGNHELYGCGFEDWKGTTGAAITAGRPPASPGEVALGRRTMDQLGVSLGDTIESNTGSPMVVVGRAVIPTLENADPGEGAILTTDGLNEHLETRGGRYLLLTYTDGVDEAALERQLTERYGVVFTDHSGPEPPGKVAQLAAMGGLLAGLGVFLGVIGLAGLVHFLAVSVRRRTREFAVLRSLGFVRRDVGLVVSWQAVTVAVVGVVVGVPLGIVVGRWAWLAAIRSAGMVDTPTLPAGWLAVVVLVTIAGGALVGAVPGWFASRRRPADGLRAE